MNGDTLKDKLPLPKIEDIIDAMAEAKIFSKFDLTSGYWQLLVVFIDDGIVFSRCWEEHLVTLEQVLERFLKYNLIAKPSICLFGTRLIDAFGYTV